MTRVERVEHRRRHHAEDRQIGQRVELHAELTRRLQQLRCRPVEPIGQGPIQTHHAAPRMRPAMASSIASTANVMLPR